MHSGTAVPDTEMPVSFPAALLPELKSRALTWLWAEQITIGDVQNDSSAEQYQTKQGNEKR